MNNSIKLFVSVISSFIIAYDRIWALDRKAEMCGIEITGGNKWKTIIENASKRQLKL
jgi:hypothetical protein